MSLLSEYLQKHPPIQIEPNWMIKSVTEEAITEMSVAIEEECRAKGVNEVLLKLYCYIDDERTLVDSKWVALPWKGKNNGMVQQSNLR